MDTSSNLNCYQLSHVLLALHDIRVQCQTSEFCVIISISERGFQKPCLRSGDLR